ncbi:MAG: 4-(cytidine 5'-diphospho)-2-C-methyl-D-erythritol kinase [Gammaproteobacteria bacterium]|nr:4-(cytidine 5'-diphospho)-2-C-methyl-D-erythritol kinase [Gammaproteobacteria bacterium]
MSSLTLTSPAKLNLMLHITGRRADGYHLLQTVFQFIDLYDRLHFEATTDLQIQRINSRTPVEQSEDIVIRAAKLLQQRYQVGRGAKIAVEKQIPVGGGLGGGSSNAASCLLALNTLWNTGLSIDQLAETGLELGADVPVFVRGFAAWADGVGEQLTPINLQERHYLVLYPNIHVSTAQIFNAEELTRNCDPITIRAFQQGTGVNVCEPVARERYVEIADALDWLNRYAEARMTGTGACIYAPFDSQLAAERVKSRLPEKWQGFVVQGMNSNPVHEQCRKFRNNSETVVSS